MRAPPVRYRRPKAVCKAMNRIVVVDYGMGNLRSVAQALRQVAPEADVRISGEVQDIRAADRVVLPGQGAMPGQTP